MSAASKQFCSSRARGAKPVAVIIFFLLCASAGAAPSYTLWNKTSDSVTEQISGTVVAPGTSATVVNSRFASVESSTGMMHLAAFVPDGSLCFVNSNSDHLEVEVPADFWLLTFLAGFSAQGVFEIGGWTVRVIRGLTRRAAATMDE